LATGASDPEAVNHLIDEQLTLAIGIAVIHNAGGLFQEFFNDTKRLAGVRPGVQ
jgi:hypothetical protein